MRRLTRTEWGKQFDYCFVCHWPQHGHEQGKFQLQTHEIAGGPMKAAAMKEPATWFRTCNSCHEDLGHNVESQVMQLAIKSVEDSENFNLEAFNRLVNPIAPNRITEEEVSAAAAELDKQA